MVIRCWVFCTLLVLPPFMQGCDKGGGVNTPLAATGSVAKQASINSSPRSVAGASDAQADKSLPAEHPSVATQGAAPLPQNPLEAMRVLKTRLDQNPHDLNTLISFGNANMMVERYSAAAELYTRALAINPKDLDVRTNLAIAYKYVPKVDQAIAELKKNLEMDPQHSASLYNLGFIYAFDKKDYKAASGLWNKWLSLYPNAEGAGQIKEYLTQMESMSSQAEPRPTK